MMTAGPTRKSLHNSPIELRHLHALAMVVREGHFGRAAKKLGVTQPLLSMRIRALENFVGERLLDRRPNIRLTAAGEAFHRSALEAMTAMDEGVTAAARAARGVTGRFAIGFPSWTITTVVPEVINAFRQEHPEVEILLRAVRSVQQIDEVGRHRMQVGFLRDPQLGDDFCVEAVFSDPWMLALPAGDPRAECSEISLDQIRGDVLMVPDRHALNAGSHMLSMVAAGGGAPGTVQEFGHWMNALSLIAHGGGVALVPASQTELWRKGIAYLPLATPQASSVCAFWKRGNEDPLLLAFLSLLRERITNPESVPAEATGRDKEARHP